MSDIIARGLASKNAASLAQKVSYPVLDGESNKVINKVYPYGDVRRYGAVCDGVTDDTTSIQNAIDYSPVNKITFPRSSNVVFNTIYVERNDIEIDGNKSTFLCNGYISVMENSRAGTNIWASMPPTNANSDGLNNLRPFKIIPYYDPVEYGGTTNRLSGVKLHDFNFMRVGNNIGFIDAFKTDNIRIENIHFIDTIQTSASKPSYPNAVQIRFGKDIFINNIEVDYTKLLSYGVFVMWGFNAHASNITTHGGSISNNRTIEFKHVVNGSMKNIYSENHLTGIRVGYGSINVTIDNVIISNAQYPLSISSSEIADYTERIAITNIVLNNCQNMLDLTSVKGLVVDGIEAYFDDSNTFTSLNIMKLTSFVNHVSFVDTPTFTSLHATTKAFAGDGDYDNYYQTQTGGIGVGAFTGYYVTQKYKETPVLKNCDFRNIKINFNEVTKNASVTMFNMNYYDTKQLLIVKTDGTFNKNSESKTYLRLENVSIKNVDIRNSTTTSKNISFNSDANLAFYNLSLDNYNLVGKFVDNGLFGLLFSDTTINKYIARGLDSIGRNGFIQTYMVDNLKLTNCFFDYTVQQVESFLLLSYSFSGTNIIESSQNLFIKNNIVKRQLRRTVEVVNTATVINNIWVSENVLSCVTGAIPLLSNVFNFTTGTSESGKPIIYTNNVTPVSTLGL